ncbi:MAG: GNAT family N-acetyltransferase [Clostridia bacterium]|nr:GNAT family N-acetyltransferase [Clostridia bacterium]
MLKFTEIENKNAEKIAAQLFSSDDYALEILESLDCSDPDVCYAVTCSDGCMIIRVFDFGRYMFLYPIELFDDADSDAAVLKLSEYVRREELPFVLLDVPTAEVSRLLELGFMHLEIDKEDESSYRVKIKTECELASQKLSFFHNDVLLDEFTEEDIADYADICRDEELNKFWGYDYKEDAPNASDEYFYTAQKEGRTAGTSMSLAVREKDTLVGEVQYFAFNGRGECEVAVRIARRYQSRGLGSRAMEAAIILAARLGIKVLFCDVMRENTHSVKMMRKFFEETDSQSRDLVRFKREI